MTFEAAVLFVVALVVTWIKPGPGQAAIITRSLNDGFVAGFCVAVGIVMGCVIYFLIAALGIALIAEYIESIGIFFKTFGALYLFYLGYRGLIHIESGKWTGRQDKLTRQEMAKNFMAGFLITMSNPITIFFFIGILPSIVPLAELTATDILILLGLLIYFGLMVDTIIAALAGQVRQTLSDDTWIKKINLVTSICMILIGSFLLYSAFFLSDFSFRL